MSERTPQDVLREDEVMTRLSSDNPKSRQHDEWRSDGRSMWRCIPIRDVVALRELILDVLDKAIAEAPDVLSEKPGLDVERLRLAALNVARAWMEERRRNHYTSEPIPLAELRAVLGSTDSEGR